MSPRNIVIIGAPRSGTNMLRNAMCALPGAATWPCDEINYVWRRGNIEFPTDALPVDRVNKLARREVRRAFSWVARKYGAESVVEKTCANSLRVPFVDEILVDPLYVYIVRDGVDAAASAREAWTAPLSVPYLVKKARFVPRRDLLAHAARYARTRLGRDRRQKGRVATWGPRFDGLDLYVRSNTPTLEVAARQWKACVDASDLAFAGIDPDRVLRVGYEEFVADPVDGLSQIAGFAGISASSQRIV